MTTFGKLAWMLPLLSVAAHASTTYVYTGPNFDLTHGSPNPTTSNNLTITLTFSAALAANLGFGLLTPASWSMSDGPDTLTSAGANTYVGFYLATDSFGDISNWQLQVNGPNGSQLMASTKSGGSACCVPTTSFYDVSLALDGTGSNFAVNNLAAGTWAIEAVPEPATAWILAPPLVWLGWRLRRRDKFVTVAKDS